MRDTHARNGRGVALCALPAKQEDLIDDWMKVTCKHCLAVMRGVKRPS